MSLIKKTTDFEKWVNENTLLSDKISAFMAANKIIEYIRDYVSLKQSQAMEGRITWSETNTIAEFATYLSLKIG